MKVASGKKCHTWSPRFYNISIIDRALCTGITVSGGYHVPKRRRVFPDRSRNETISITQITVLIYVNKQDGVSILVVMDRTMKLLAI